MKINKITISNFRSIASVRELPIDKFNVFVGQNNHGKTNFFEAIEWFFNDGSDENIIKKESDKASVFVEFEFIDCQEAIDRIKTQIHKTKIKNTIGDNETIRVRRKLSEPKKLYYINSSEQEVDFGTGLDKALLEFFPKLQFVKTETTLKEVAKYGRKTPISEMLSEVLEQVLEDETGSRQYKAFKKQFDLMFGDEGVLGKALIKIASDVNRYVNKQFECQKVTFKPSLPTFEDIFKNIETMVNDGSETSAAEKGDGMQRSLMLAIIQTYADYRRQKENSKEFIFLIDEGELHLHPTAQRSLKNALIELANAGDQVLLTTHSSVLIADVHPGQVLFKVEKLNSNTSINIVTDEDKQDLVYDLLGGSPSDLLLPSNFLIVEGKSEFTFFKKIIERFYADRKGIKIIQAYGDTDQASKLYSCIEKLFTPINASIYKNKVVFLLDMLSNEKMSEGAFEDFLAKFPDINQEEQIFLLPVQNIEEYYPVALPTQINAQNDIPKWKRTNLEANRMRCAQKIKLAEVIGNKITLEQFISEMPQIHEALEKCWHNCIG